MPVLACGFGSAAPVIAKGVALQLRRCSVGPRFREGHDAGFVDALRSQISELVEQRPDRIRHEIHGIAHPAPNANE
jgi:hypothetical protein